MLFVIGNSGSQKQSAFLNLFLNGGGRKKEDVKSLKVQEQNSYFSQLLIRDSMNPFLS